MKILGIIPAREGSKSIYKKNIKMLAGKPLIAYTAEVAKKSTYLTRIVLSTDSVKIARIARQLEIEVPFMRPAELARDDTPTIAVIEHTVRALKEKENYIPDIIVILQPTAPFRTTCDIDTSIKKLIDSKTDSVVSVCEVPHNYHPYWQLVIIHEQLALYGGESLSNIISRRQDLSKTYYRNGAVYVFWANTLLKKNSLYGDVCFPYIMPQDRSINIDRIADWKLAEDLIKRNDEKG